MTVVDAQPERGSGDAKRIGGVDELLTGVEQCTDLADGRGPAWLDAWLREGRSDLLGWRRLIHARPELARDEYATTELVSGLLRSLGLKPEVLPNGTGLICDIGEGDRCVALRADIDALPLHEDTGLAFASTVDGVAHACGHDAHAAILLGVAHALASAPRLPGRVRLLFQPAEEVIPGGALEVIDAGGLDGVQHIYGLHCEPRLDVGTVGIRNGAITSATDFIDLALHSPGGHTARPHLTADVVGALGTVITGVPGLLTRRVDPRSGTVLTWGAVEAGHASNTVPEYGRLRGTLRTGDRDTWVSLEPLVREFVRSLLGPTGVGFEFDYHRGMPPVVNEQASTALLAESATAALGGQSVAETPQSSGGEDFAWYLEDVPGSFVRLGVHPGQGPRLDIHQSSFDIDERALPVGVRLLTTTAVRALTSLTETT